MENNNGRNGQAYVPLNELRDEQTGGYMSVVSTVGSEHIHVGVRASPLLPATLSWVISAILIGVLGACLNGVFILLGGINIKLTSLLTLFHFLTLCVFIAGGMGVLARRDWARLTLMGAAAVDCVRALISLVYAFTGMSDGTAAMHTFRTMMGDGWPILVTLIVLFCLLNIVYCVLLFRHLQSDCVRNRMAK